MSTITKRHLANSNIILLGIAALGVVFGIYILMTNASIKDQGGNWVQDSRGVWMMQGRPGIPPAAVRQQEFLIREAQLAYTVVKNSGADMEKGPCLGVIFNDWVADTVHSPRQPVDDQPENQCPQIISGTANHFIELSLDGSVVRVQ